MDSYPAWPPNEAKPALSHSAIKMFQSCDRKWALNYLTDFLPRDTKWEVKKEKLLTSLPLLRGSIVHETIEYAIEEFIEHKSWPPDLPAIAREIASSYFTFSKKWTAAVKSRQGWPRADKGQRPIDLVYYDGAFPKETARSLMESIKKPLAYFTDVIVPDYLLGVEPEFWLVPPRGEGIAFPWFWSGEIPVYAVYDFAMRAPGKTTIIDWKTGLREGNEEAVEKQLGCYAAFAVSQWGVDLQDIEIVAVWLDDGSTGRFEIEEDLIEQLGQRWRDMYSLLRGRQERVMRKPDSLFSLFPTTSDDATCRWCAFRSCERHPQAVISGAPVEAADWAKTSAED